jgi:hypothetical protein
VEAYKPVGSGERRNAKARLFVFSLFLISPCLLISRSAQAQADSSQSTTQQQPAQAPAAPPPVPAQTPEERARVLREAQARVNARREARRQQIIRETYGAKFEAYFGGGYLRFHPGQYKQRNNEADWNVGITDYIRPKLGVTADFRGYYGTAYIGNNPYGIFLPSISQYTFLFGPQYRVYTQPKLAVSLQALAGVGHGNFDTGTGGLPASYLGLYSDGPSFNLSLSAPVDYNLSPGLAIRINPLYLMTTYGGSVQNNLGFNANVVYRWGKR